MGSWSLQAQAFTPLLPETAVTQLNKEGKPISSSSGLVSTKATYNNLVVLTFGARGNARLSRVWLECFLSAPVNQLTAVGHPDAQPRDKAKV